MTTETKVTDWKKTGLGDLPPIVHLDVADVVIGKLADVRDITRKADGKKGVDKKQIALHFFAVGAFTLSKGSVKKKTKERVEMKGEEKFCITIGGNLSTLLKDMLLKETGVQVEDDLSAADLRPLIGREMKIARLEDGEIQKGAWKGNMVKRFTLDYR